MNNVFNINRFWSLLLKDFKSMLTQGAQSILVVMGVYFAGWLFSVLFSDTPVALSNRAAVLGISFFLIFLIAPSKLYYYINREREGTYYGLLPVSTFEKFLSMLVITVIAVPVLFCAVMCAFDAVLTILPFDGGFDEFILPHFTVGDVIGAVLALMMLQSVYIFGNTVFKKHEFRNTTLWIILFWVVTMIALSIFFVHLYDANGEVFEMWISNLDKNPIIIFMLETPVVPIIITLLFYLGSFWKLKKTTY